jgi:hypothetical protein
LSKGSADFWDAAMFESPRLSTELDQLVTKLEAQLG